MKRVTGLDIVRFIAILFVISVHFLLNTNFYQMPQKDGYGMIVLSFLRHLFLICVPLFIILTGYLNRNKEPNKDYYSCFILSYIKKIFFDLIEKKPKKQKT